MSLIKRVLIGLVVVTTVFVVGLYSYSKMHTYMNDDNELGNTAGNIYNGGLFCEQNNTIYFSNDNDDGSLYSMTSYYTHIRKVSNEKAVFINADANYIYYVRAKDPDTVNQSSLMMFNNAGVYRISHNGTGLKAYAATPSAYLILNGNFLYYLNYNADDGYNLYRTKIDRTMNRTLIKAPAVPIVTSDNQIYYTDYSKNNNIYAMYLNSFTTHPHYTGSYKYPIIKGDYLYYINLSDHNRLYRMKKDGSEPAALTDNACSTYNITNSGKSLYYQQDSGKKSGAYRLDLQTMKSTILRKGNFKQIYVTQNYIFMKDDKYNTYILPVDESTGISLFQTAKAK